MAAIRLPVRDKNTRNRAMIKYLTQLQANQESNVIQTIRDALNNIIVSFSTVASPVNYLTLVNASSGNNPSLTASGSDTDVGIDFIVKNNDVFRFQSSGGYSTTVIWRDAGVRTITFSMPTALTASRSIVWPDASGTIILTPGSVDQTVLGTVAVGTWTANTVDELYGGTGQNAYVLGDTLYASAANTLARLPGNTSTTSKVLTQTGTGTASAAPVWSAAIASTFNYTYPGSSFTRTAQSRLEDRVSVKDFGAVGDNVTDDTAAIQLALDTARCIYMPPGTYKITDTLVISNSGQTLLGGGQDNTVISSSAAGATISIAANVEHPLFRDFSLTRPLAARPAISGQDGIKFVGYTNLAYLENIYIEYHYVAYHLNVTGFSYIHNCWANLGISHGFYCHQGTTVLTTFQWTLNRCFVQVCGGNGYFFLADNANASVGEMINCVTYSNTLDGLRYEANAPYGIYGVRISGGFVGSDDGAGIHLKTNVSYGSKISNVYSELCGTYGIQLESGSGRTTITDCFLTANNWDGIYSDVTELNMSGTTILGSGQASVVGKKNGIHVASGRANISNCQIIANNEYGVLLDTDGNSVSCNDLTSNTSGPVGATVSLITTQLLCNLPATQTTNLSLSSGLKDTNSKAIINFTATASAVNNFTVINAATGGGPRLSATGSDINIGMSFLTKGSGDIVHFSDGLFYMSNIAATHSVAHNIASITAARTATWPDASGTVVLTPGSTGITTLGTIGTGTWQGTSISTTYTDAKLKTLTGTTNRITIGGTATDPTVDVSTSYAGQATITTLGTIGTGTWNATKIGLVYGGTNADLSATGGTSKVLRQSSAGADITVSQLDAADITYTYPSSGYTRSSATRLQDYVSVKDYGALGDGANDDTSAINACIAANRNVWFPPGTYKVTGTISIGVTGQKLQGAGVGATSISSSAAGATISIAAGKSWIELKDFHIIKPGAALPATAGQHGIYAEGTINLCVFENVEVFYHYDGFNLGKTGYSSIINCYAGSNYNHGFHFNHSVTTGSMQWTLLKCLAELNNGIGIYFHATNGVTSVGDLVSTSSFANGQGGIWYVAASASHYIAGIRIIGGLIGQDNGDELKLDTYGSNSIHRINSLYIELAGTAASGVGQAIPATLTGYGINITANNGNVSVVNSIISGSSYDGIVSSCTTLTVASTHIFDNGGGAVVGKMNGIRTLAGVAKITNCHIKGNDEYGVRFASDGNILTENLFATNTSGDYTGDVAQTTSQIFGNLPATLTTNISLSNAGIKDTNSKTIIGLNAVASAVNYVTTANAVTTDLPYLLASGSDTNISIGVVAKGTGLVLLRGNDSGAVRFSSLADGSHTVTHSLASVTTARTITWPDRSGTVVLQGDTDTPLTTPKITTNIKDTNGNVWIAQTAAGSAVNYITIGNSATGNRITWTATGSDTNIGINYSTKGSGAHTFLGTVGNVQTWADLAASTNSVTHSLSGISAARTVTWPDKSGVSVLEGFTSTVTAAGTTTLTVSSDRRQEFTGSMTQTCTLPVVSTLKTGTTYVIYNQSSGNVTVNSSGGNTLSSLVILQKLTATSRSTSGTGTASWTWDVATLTG